MVSLKYSHTNLFEIQLCLSRAYCNICVEHSKYIQISGKNKGHQPQDVYDC